MFCLRKSCNFVRKSLNFLQSRTSRNISFHRIMANRMESKLEETYGKFCVDISRAQEKVVCQACEEYGFELVDNFNDDCFLAWTNWPIGPNDISILKSYQKVNFFLNIDVISRKNLLADNVKRVQKSLWNDFNIIPTSWVLPEEYHNFNIESRSNINNEQMYICKPRHSAMGEGIWLVKDPDEIKADDSMVIQEYIDKPMLIDGYKFDLRLYVLVTCCDPLKIYLYQDGMVRMASTPYHRPTSENMNDFYMHLTNTSINKFNRSSAQTDTKNIRTLKWFKEWLREENASYQEILNNIEDVVIKSLLIANPHVKYAYHKHRNGTPVGDSFCFHLLGVDVLLDADGKPWLLETNTRPSLVGTFLEMKQKMIRDVLKLVNIRPADRSVDVERNTSHHENRAKGDFQQIFPPPSNEQQEYYSRLQKVCDQANEGHLIEPRNNELLKQIQRKLDKDREMRKRRDDIFRQNLKTDEQKVDFILQQFHEFQIDVINDTDYSRVDKLLGKVNTNWKEHGSIVSNFWLNVMTTADREEMIEAIRAITKRSIQRVWRIWDVKHLQEVLLYKALNEMLATFVQNDGRLFAELCMHQGDDGDLERLDLPFYKELSDTEKQCCERIFVYCKEYAIVKSHMESLTASTKGYVYGLRCLSRKQIAATTIEST